MSNPVHRSRRDFLKQASLLGITGLSSAAWPASLSPQQNENQQDKMYTILFQGDSITDGNRTRDHDLNHVLGHGYAYLIAARLWYEFPQKGYQFYNRGISGNQISDLKKRWTEDTLALKPDLVSILIGVNDCNNAVHGNKNSTPAGFKNDYRKLLSDTTRQLPGVDLVICEPFILPAGIVQEKWDAYHREMLSRQEITRKIALEFNALFIPLQDLFNEAAKKNPPAAFWLWDGVHPMPNGHELIAREWIEKVITKSPDKITQPQRSEKTGRNQPAKWS